MVLTETTIPTVFVDLAGFVAIEFTIALLAVATAVGCLFWSGGGSTSGLLSKKECQEGKGCLAMVPARVGKEEEGRGGGKRKSRLCAVRKVKRESVFEKY